MKRDLKKLSSEKYDVVVIGAGIYGVATAWDATLRGLKVALIDKGDFGNATSANSLKTIHGGLRYLQNLDIIRMRESIHERMVLMNIAPNLIYPLPVLMPTYSHKLKSRPALAAALIANDIVGFDRNGLDDPHKFMPRGHTMSSKKLKQLIPGYDKYNLNGGALWYDCQCYNTERLALSYVLSATQKGADAANYVTATGFLSKNQKVCGIKVKDSLTGESFDIQGKMIVNDGGPWVDKILSNLNGKVPAKKFSLSSALNLIVDRDIMGEYAAGLSGPFKHTFADGSEYNAFRILFFAPWRGKTIIGTNHLPYDGDLNEYKVTEKEIQSFLADVNQAHPAANIKRDEVSYFYGGFLPTTGLNPKTGEVQLVRHYQLHDHSVEDQVNGLITAVGVKYTTARDVAKKTVDLVFQKMEKKSPPCQTEETRLYGGEIEKFEDFLNDNINSKPFGLDEKVMKHLSYNYGSAFQDILSYGKENKEVLQKITGSEEVVKAEVVHAVQQEMALKLSDVVLRRTDLGSGGSPGEKALADTAQVMGVELGWDKTKIKQEIAEVEQVYIPGY
ncbi:glycerol-3-phosphate dehydrogenase/oxidase [candidate division KSB1 bacterium]|nr:glycerol-3-phosphate dehydrogenase/oxidase [candidate division KSB1 bacterium]